MPSAVDPLIARLQADCTAAEAAERTVRAEVEADVKADPLDLNRGRFFDREGRHLRVDEVAR